MDYFFSFIKANRHSNIGALYEQADNQLRNTYESTPLREPNPLPISLSDALAARQSAQTFSTTESLSLTEIETILLSSYTTSDVDKRPAPSAGGLQPLNLYLVVPKDTPALATGTYYYNTKEHSLDLLSRSAPDIGGRMPDPEKIERASLYICISHVKARNLFQYGTLGYTHAFLEAGHIGQNIYLTAAALNIGCRAIGAPLYDLLDDSFVTIAGSEHVIYTLALGKTDVETKENR